MLEHKLLEFKNLESRRVWVSYATFRKIAEMFVT